MYNDEDVSRTLLDLSISTETAVEKWRRWAAQETQLRAILGHYILDSQISYYTGGPSGHRHASNPLRIPSDNCVFQASTVEEWISKTKITPVRSITFAELFNMLFSPESGDEYLSSQLPSLTAYVLLEGLKSLMMESDEVRGGVVGVPSKDEIFYALARMHHCIMASHQMSSLDRGNVLLRWHSVCLEATADPISLCCQMCITFDIEQKVFGMTNSKKRKFVNLKEWTETLGAKRALLHAIAIWDILQDLPFGRAHAIHVPASIFTAAVVYCAFCVAGVPVLQIPSVKNWPVAMGIGLDSSRNPTYGEEIELTDFLTQQYDTLRSPGTPIRNLLYDLCSLPVYLKNLSNPWGIAGSMAEILEQLVTCCGA